KGDMNRAIHISNKGTQVGIYRPLVRNLSRRSSHTSIQEDPRHHDSLRRRWMGSYTTTLFPLLYTHVPDSSAERTSEGRNSMYVCCHSIILHADLVLRLSTYFVLYGMQPSSKRGVRSRTALDLGRPRSNHVRDHRPTSNLRLRRRRRRRCRSPSRRARRRRSTASCSPVSDLIRYG
ncbi:hypothetical protein BJ912DRAFT_957769, partial [Pholiota molesta]